MTKTEERIIAFMEYWAVSRKEYWSIVKDKTDFSLVVVVVIIVLLFSFDTLFCVSLLRVKYIVFYE